ncbi:hypothetical protein PV325_006032 [Microctonus aethiopoides]|uniref:Uncharacterized protein n=1 Tax=Microctonus aethiopoides TaxID=144406 RepID=A0AA39FW33_9HYME|nr:hypothetical protein PV325_006032 [Microctonus aethiopoides]KAK0082276.1 hypothetical protein PV326_007265 [Microctonus aethiopoides]KAK0176942.1 hypothetical protein PV328_001040 [Microctonus aethiopoides]
MSRLQKLDRLRELAYEYTEALKREGLDKDFKVQDLATRVVAETLRGVESAQSMEPLAIEWRELPLPRGALSRPPTVLQSNYAMIIAGWKCPHCNVLPPTKVVPFASTERTVEPIAARSTSSVNERLRLKQPEKDSNVLPLLSREERKARLMELLKILRYCPRLERAAKRGCFNCTEPHHHRDCPYRRGTFCGRCGEPGMAHDECPRCYPEKYNLIGVEATKRREA